MQKSLLFKNAKISFSDTGKGTAVVFLHGFLENSTMWNAITPELESKNRIITIDLLGHGKTDCLGYVHSMENFASAVEAVLKHLKLRKYILIGHSLGGYVCLQIAKNNPSKIKGLCLLNSTSNADSKEKKELRIRANKMASKNFKNMVRMSFANLFGVENKSNFKEKMELAIQQALKTPLQGYIAANEGMRIRKNTNAVVTENNLNTLFVLGDKDPVLDPKKSLLEVKNTNSKAVVFSGGHMSHIENETELCCTLNDFIKTC